MKYREILLNQLKSMPYFSKGDITALGGQYNLKQTTVDAYIGRSLARKELIQLRKGLYTTTHFYEANRGDISYPFYLGNVIRSPSYVSTWAALQYYNLTTEAIHGITSVTQKVTRTYHTKAGHYTYHSIKNGLFSGFSLIKEKFTFFMASPSKALFDLLYFKTRQFRGIRAKQISTMVNELRIDLEEMDKKERNKFYLLIKDYLENYG